MPFREPSSPEAPQGIGLRTELAFRNLRLASDRGFLHERSDGQVPSIVFGRDENGRHGNFHPAAYERICANMAWAERLAKVHTSSKRMRLRCNWQWKELDCCSSSDALLMNIFCHPDVFARRGMRAILNIESDTLPEFGFKPRVPLNRGMKDTTEVDMKIGELLVEAKLTETHFQWATSKLLSRYRDLETVFHRSELPIRNGKYGGYQLIRSILAAYALNCSFCLFCDARRPELIEVWYTVLRAVRPIELRCRLRLLTWQELAATLPPDLQDFLAIKYGIFGEVCVGAD